MKDNRHYVWENDALYVRPEYPVVERWIVPGARVLDLGCGNGALLRLLKEKKQVVEFGIELAPSGVELCRQHGLNARVGRIDEPLADLADDAFDFAICTATLQMLAYPEVMLQEMKRVARFQILSFPNFGFVGNRLELLLLGRMPRKMLGGYHWYDTGHYHQLAVSDFKVTVSQIGQEIVADAYLGRLGKLIRLRPTCWRRLRCSC